MGEVDKTHRKYDFSTESRRWGKKERPLAFLTKWCIIYKRVIFLENKYFERWGKRRNCVELAAEKERREASSPHRSEKY